MHATRDPEAELELHELLGEGAYGAVYRAERACDGREVAVKIIPAEDDAESLRKEIGIMLKCSRCVRTATYLHSVLVKALSKALHRAAQWH
jgi:serine/threonine protein kinase